MTRVRTTDTLNRLFFHYKTLFSSLWYRISTIKHILCVTFYKTYNSFSYYVSLVHLLVTQAPLIARYGLCIRNNFSFPSSLHFSPLMSDFFFRTGIEHRKIIHHYYWWLTSFVLISCSNLMWCESSTIDYRSIVTDECGNIERVQHCWNEWSAVVEMKWIKISVINFNMTRIDPYHTFCDVDHFKSIFQCSSMRSYFEIYHRSCVMRDGNIGAWEFLFYNFSEHIPGFRRRWTTSNPVLRWYCNYFHFATMNQLMEQLQHYFL